jgi:peptidoglycan/LPS O-acetylase OafA/YrhL
VFNGITQEWSLCMEVSFYLFLLLYAALIYLRRRLPQRHLVWELSGLIVLTATSYAFRWWFLHLPILTVRNGKFVATCAPNCATHPVWPALMCDWLPLYLDLFALAMLLAVVSVWFAEQSWEPTWLRHQLMPWISWTCAAWTCAAFCFWAVSHVVNDKNLLYFITPEANIERQALYGAFAFFLLLPAVFGPQDRSLVRRLLRSWPMASLGVISYGIYLWHLDLLHLCLQWTGWLRGHEPFWILALLVFAMSVAFASGSDFVLERPLLRLKGRISWWGRSSSAPKDRRPLPAEAKESQS